MKYAFQKIQLEADSFYALITTWAEMQLEVTEDSALIRGYGFAPEIAEAFTTLVLDWEAEIRLPEIPDGLTPGAYDLIELDGLVYACREGEKFRLADGEVSVEIVSQA